MADALRGSMDAAEVLFINARKLGRMLDRTHRELTDAEILRITEMYHLWCGEKSVPPEKATQTILEQVELLGWNVAA